MWRRSVSNARKNKIITLAACNVYDGSKIGGSDW